MHLPSPCSSLNLPAEHATHGPPFGPKWPGRHAQSEMSSLAAGATELDGHSEHAPAPALSLYLPSSHEVHGPPCGPVKPKLHMQSSFESLPGKAWE